MLTKQLKEIGYVFTKSKFENPRSGVSIRNNVAVLRHTYKNHDKGTSFVRAKY
jgi:hypothetical protein